MQKFDYYPYKKLTGCLSVAKDLANCRSDMVFLIGPWKVFNYLGNGSTTLPQNVFHFLLNSKIKIESNSTPPLLKCPYRPLVAASNICIQ